MAWCFRFVIWNATVVVDPKKNNLGNFHCCTVVYGVKFLLLRDAGILYIVFFFGTMTIIRTLWLIFIGIQSMCANYRDLFRIKIIIFFAGVLHCKNYARCIHRKWFLSLHLLHFALHVIHKEITFYSLQPGVQLKRDDNYIYAQPLYLPFCW